MARLSKFQRVNSIKSMDHSLATGIKQEELGKLLADLAREYYK